jgi:hypothetical protein
MKQRYGIEMVNFPSDLAFELRKKSQEIRKPIYASYCDCGTVSIKSSEKFTKEEKEYCPKCNPKPMTVRELLLLVIYSLPTLALIIWLFTN